MIHGFMQMFISKRLRPSRGNSIVSDLYISQKISHLSAVVRNYSSIHLKIDWSFS